MDHYRRGRRGTGRRERREAGTPQRLRRSPRLTLRCTLIAAASLAAIVLAAQDHPAEPHRHPDAQAIKNPVASTPESVGAGAKIYARFCAVCHGASGAGDGKLAVAIAGYGGIRPSDLTDETWQHGPTDGEIFVVIRDGIGPDYAMDAWRGKLTDEEIWNTVNYIKSLGAQK